jgi:hypothetical protein
MMAEVVCVENLAAFPRNAANINIGAIRRVVRLDEGLKGEPAPKQAH